MTKWVLIVGLLGACAGGGAAKYESGRNRPPRYCIEVAAVEFAGDYCAFDSDDPELSFWRNVTVADLQAKPMRKI
jgi:hypothetical protein